MHLYTQEHAALVQLEWNGMECYCFFSLLDLTKLHGLVCLSAPISLRSVTVPVFWSQNKCCLRVQDVFS
jgi:hypothetical protein